MESEKPPAEKITPAPKSILKKTSEPLSNAEASSDPPPPPQPLDDADFSDEDFEDQDEIVEEGSEVEEEDESDVPEHKEPVIEKLKPLRKLFEKFANQENDCGEIFIDLPAILEWFGQAKVFTAIKLKSNDVTVMFNRMKTDSLGFSEFKTFIKSVAKRGKVEPDTILYRLRLCVNQEFDKQWFHASLPEGSADRVVDAFRDLSQFVEEKYYDASFTEYVEPACNGGIRPRYKEDQAEYEEDKARIDKLRSIERQFVTDPIFDSFILFAKDGDYYSDGRTIKVGNLIRWMKQAGIFNNETCDISTTDAVFLYKQLYGIDARIHLLDLRHYMKELGHWKRLDPEALLELLDDCGPPAQRSISIVHMRVPLSVGNAMVGMLETMSRKFDETAKEYIPNSEDKPSGHTQLSRDRFFQEKIEARHITIGSEGLDESKQIPRTPVYEKYLANQDKKEKSKKKRKNVVPLIEDDDDAAGANKNRAKKNYFTQRWDGAYPYGGHERATRPIRLDPDIQRYLNGVSRRRSSEEILTDKERKLLAGPTGLVPVTFSTKFEPVSFPEQFRKFCEFRTQHPTGITTKNLERWLIQAHIVDGHLVTVNDVRNVYKKYRESSTFDIETMTTILTAISRKKHLSLVEVMDRLCRCGPPRFIDVEKFVTMSRPPNHREQTRISEQKRKASIAAAREERRASVAQQNRKLSTAGKSGSATQRNVFTKPDAVPPKLKSQRKLSSAPASAPEKRPTSDTKVKFAGV